MSEFRTTLRKSLSDLAGRCDHAVSQDDVGFSSATASKGHELASLPDRFWNDRIEEPAAYVVLHHRKQLLDRNELDPLDAARIANAFPPTKGLSTIPSEWISFDFEAGVFVASIAEKADRLRAKAVPGAFQPAGRGRIWRIPKEYGFVFSLSERTYDADDATKAVLDEAKASADPDLVASISDRRVSYTADTRSFLLAYPFDGELNAFCRPEFRWNGAAMAAPDTAAARAKVSDLVRGHAFHLPRAVAEMMDRVPPPAPTAPAGRPSPRMTSVHVGGRRPAVEISFVPYVSEWVDAVRSLPREARSWNGDRKCWTVAASAAPDLAARLRGMERVPCEEDLRALDPEPGATPRPG